MNEIQINNKTKTIDSREIAEMLGKKHHELLKEIEGRKDGKNVGIIPILEKGNFHVSDYFIKSIFKAPNNNKTYPCYLITKRGCEVLGNKQQGEKGILFTATYVKRFNEMENADKQSKAIITVEKGLPQPIKLERKIYKCQPVLTLRDIENVTGISKFNLNYYIRESKIFNFIDGVDFETLKGASLKRYKVQNGLEGSIISSLTIVFKSAIDKFTEQGYITSPEAIKTLRDYFTESKIEEPTVAGVINVSFLEQIQAFKIVSEDLNLNSADKVQVYNQIYELNGLNGLKILSI